MRCFASVGCEPIDRKTPLAELKERFSDFVFSVIDSSRRNFLPTPTNKSCPKSFEILAIEVAGAALMMLVLLSSLLAAASAAAVKSIDLSSPPWRHRLVAFIFATESFVR
jgi:hypothetical protein